MACKRCSSDKLAKFRAEMNLHFPGYENLTKTTVWAFEEVVVCLDCGLLECTVSEPALRKLGESDAA